MKVLPVPVASVEQDALLARPRWPPAPARWRCPDSSGSGSSRPCPRRERRRSGRARRSASAKVQVPEFVRRGEVTYQTLGSCDCNRAIGFIYVGWLLNGRTAQVHSVDTVSIRCIGEADSHFPGVVLGLGDPLGFGEVFTLGLDDGELAVLINEDVVSCIGICARPAPIKRPWVILNSRRIRELATTPQPAARRAGSINSARVSDSFMDAGSL